jgi:hypothetical protein
VIREELLPEKYIEVKKSIRADPTKVESVRIYPAVMDLGSLESRVAARTLAERRKDSRMRIKIRCIGQKRPANQPKPKHRNGPIETYYIDDDDYKTKE